MIFNIYTYQFKPIYQERTLFCDPDLEAKKAMEKKNIIFAEALKDVIFAYRNKKHNVHFIVKTNDFFIFQISNPRKIIIEKSFQVSEELNEPSAYVIIHNDREVQRMAIQQDLLAFSDTNVVASIITNSVRQVLQDAFLQISIRREYSRSEFWDIVNANSDQITSIKFKFDYPNLPRVRSLIPEMLKNASARTRSSTTTLEFEAEKDRTLYIDENDKDIQELNNGAADCGSEVAIGLKGFRRKIRTGHTTKEIELDELQIIGNPNDIKDILKSIV